MNEKVNLQDIIDSLAEKHGLNKAEAEAFVKEFFLLIEQGLEKKFYVKVKGLGTFKLIEVENRESIDVNTGERIEIQGHTKVSFTPDSTLRDAVNKPFAHFETVPLNDETVLENTVVNTVEEVGGEEAPALQLPAEEIIARELANSRKAYNIVELEKNIAKPESEKKDSASKQITQATIKSHAGFLVTVVLVVLVLCGGTVAYLYFPDLLSSGKSVTPPQAVESVVVQEHPTVGIDTLLADSLLADSLRADTLVTGTLHSEALKEDTAAIIYSNSIKPESTPKKSNFTIIGTYTNHTLMLGESLSTLSIKYYGKTDFWSFIVEYNSDIITDPDNVPADALLKIPRLKAKE